VGGREPARSGADAQQLGALAVGPLDDGHVGGGGGLFGVGVDVVQRPGLQRSARVLDGGPEQALHVGARQEPRTVIHLPPPSPATPRPSPAPRPARPPSGRRARPPRTGTRPSSGPTRRPAEVPDVPPSRRPPVAPRPTGASHSPRACRRAPRESR